MTNESIKDGPAPARSAVPEAAVPTVAKIPAPMMAPIPMSVTLNAVSVRFSAKLWTADAGQNFIKVLGVKNSSKQGVASGIGFR
jgi:hypothetical protein